MLHRLILRERPLITILLDFKKYKWVLKFGKYYYFANIEPGLNS